MARTGYYLLDTPPASQQFYGPPRANRLTGGVGIHTTESVMDSVGPDTGAENVASYIARRSEPGSYHAIADSDSLVPMLPDDFTAFSIAADGHNSRTVSIAFACRTSDLDPGSEWTRRAFGIAALWVVGFWKRNGFDPVASARWLPAGETLSGPGIFHHGTAQPWDRSDAFARHPRRGELETLFLSALNGAAGASVPTVPGGSKVKPFMARNPKTGEIAIMYPDTPFRVRLNAKQVETCKFLGVPYNGDVDPFFFDVTSRVATGS